MFLAQFGDFILMLVRAKLELGDFLLGPDAPGKPAVRAMNLAIESDLLGMDNFSTRTEFQSDGRARTLEHTGQGEGTVDRNGGSRIGLSNAFTLLPDAEEGVGNRDKFGLSLGLGQVGQIQVGP